MKYLQEHKDSEKKTHHEVEKVETGAYLSPFLENCANCVGDSTSSTSSTLRLNFLFLLFRSDL
jgi:hypothetical protein